MSLQHESLPLVTQLNRRLDSSIQARDYSAIKALVVYWEDGEEGFKEEAHEVKTLFENLFHYSVVEFAIPSKSPRSNYYSLLQAVIGALCEDSNTAGPSLLIIHYGGHGDSNDDRRNGEERRSVWAAHSTGEPTLQWFKIQDQIMDSETDVLLLLDCCYAAQAARARENGQGKFEILAAAAMGMMTPKPGPKSFTHTLIREVQDKIESDGFVVIKDLHGPLCDRRRGLFATPVHITLKAGYRPLRLEPIATSHKARDNRQEATSILHLLVQIRDELTHDSAGKVSEWLGADIPRIVSGLKIIEKTQHVECIVKAVDERQDGYAQQLEPSARDEILASWEKIVTLVSSFHRPNEAQRPSVDIQKHQAREFLKQLDTGNSRILDAFERSILSCGDFGDGSILEDAADDDHIKALGLDSQLRMRRIVLAADVTHPSHGCTSLNEFSDCRNDDLVLQEFKAYGHYIDPKEMPALERRVMLLAHLLASSDNEEFRALKCLGWSHQKLERKYTLDFKVPRIYSRSHVVSLHSVIKEFKGSHRPTLDERFIIARQVAKAIRKWHLVGWVHQGISSHNIIFFLNDMTGDPDYARPFLYGFEFARPDSDPSLGSAMEDLEFNVYRHPDRQGTARKGHRKKHDVYSLGVVLLEIGVWQCAIAMLKVKQQPTPPQTRAQLQRHCSERLAHYAGASFQSAVDNCLSSELGVTIDDESGSQMAKEFQKQVLDRLDEGIKAT